MKNRSVVASTEGWGGLEGLGVVLKRQPRAPCGGGTVLHFDCGCGHMNLHVMKLDTTKYTHSASISAVIGI